MESTNKPTISDWIQSTLTTWMELVEALKYIFLYWFILIHRCVQMWTGRVYKKGIYFPLSVRMGMFTLSLWVVTLIGMSVTGFTVSVSSPVGWGVAWIFILVYFLSSVFVLVTYSYHRYKWTTLGLIQYEPLPRYVGGL